MSQIITYAQDISANIGGSVIWTTTPSYTCNGGTSQPVAVNAPPGYNLGGVLVSYSVTYTPTGAVSAASNKDALDGVLSGYDVMPSIAGGTSRLRTITRAGVEEAERVFLQPETTSLSFQYPRATPASFTATTTARTDTGVFFIPASGGTGCGIRFNLPTATSVYAASVSSTVMYTLYAVPTLNDLENAVLEQQSNSYGAGSPDISFLIPWDMTVSYLDFIGLTASASTLYKVVVTGASGSNTVDFEDAPAILGAQSIFPNSPVASYTNSVFALKRDKPTRLQVGIGGTTTFDLLFMDCYGGKSTVAAAPATGVASGTALAQNIGQTAAGGASVQPAKGNARRLA